MCACVAVVRGHVQGVYYRDYVAREARALGLAGHVGNLADAVSVEVYVEGEMGAVDRLLERLRDGPPLSRIDSVEVDWRDPVGRAAGFEIRW
ncbi:MAG: acylphosphatase [Chloroflexi bacterium]|nr:acylphosphatase [Chloroflexota bacterium]